MKSSRIFVVWSVLLAAFVLPGLAACGPGGESTANAPESTASQSEDAGSTSGTSVSEEAAGVSDQPEQVASPDDENAYIEEIEAVNAEFSTAFLVLDDLLLIPDFANDEWMSEVALAASDILVLCEHVAEISPPDTVIDDHLAYLDATMYVNNAVALLLEGLDKAEPNLVDQASAEIWLASEVMTEFS